MTEKDLIKQLVQLKEIKPNQEWVNLLKSEILNSKSETNPNFSISQFLNFFFAKKLAYSFATLAFVIVGLVGFAQYTMPGDLLFPIRKIAEQSEAALTGQTGLRQNATGLNNRINDLAKAAKEGRLANISSAVNEVNTKALELAKNLKESPVKDSETLKEIAVSLKTLANVTGTGVEEAPEIKDLYKAVVENQIVDLKEATLTEEQAELLIEAEALYDEQKYVEALEKILEINN